MTSWAALVEVLEDNYGLSLFEAPEYALFILNQDDSVANYYENFTAVANRVEGLTPRIMLACFLSGLKINI